MCILTLHNLSLSCSSPHSSLSASDVVFSLGMLLSPFLSPRDTVLRPAFSMGNTQSCEFAGYLFIMGMVAVPSYTLFLTYYFLRRVKYSRVTQRTFALKEEKVLHCCLHYFYISISNYCIYSKRNQ